MAQLELKNLSVHFGGVKAVQNVSLQIEKGEFRGLIGPNGAGKTTVFNAVTGAAQPTQGEIYFEGTKLNGMRPDKIAHMGIARTFQNIRIYPKMTAAENVAIGLESYPSYNAFSAMLRLPHVVRRDKEIKRLSLEYLDRVGILEYKDHEAGALPYGLQRKLEIARAMAGNPKLLFLDEPAAGMNTQEGLEMVTFLKELHSNNTDLTIVLIEHHLEVVMQLCQTINVLNLGSLLAYGTPKEVQCNPDVIKAYLGERRKTYGE